MLKMRTGYHGRSRDIRVRPTTSGHGWRVFSTRTGHVGECFPNGRGGITVRLDGKYLRTENPPNCVDGAGRRLIGLVRARVSRRKATESEERLRVKSGWLHCHSCHQLEPYKGYVDRRTGQCQLCNEMATTIADENEREAEMMARAYEAAAKADTTFCDYLKPMMDEVDAAMSHLRGQQTIDSLGEHDSDDCLWDYEHGDRELNGREDEELERERRLLRDEEMMAEVDRHPYFQPPIAD